MILLGGYSTENGGNATNGNSGATRGWTATAVSDGTCTHIKANPTNLIAGSFLTVRVDIGSDTYQLVAYAEVTSAGLQEFPCILSGAINTGTEYILNIESSGFQNLAADSTNTGFNQEQSGGYANPPSDTIGRSGSNSNRARPLFEMIDNTPQGPSLNTPPSIDGTQAGQVFTGNQLSTTRDNVVLEFSRDNFSTIDGSIAWPLTVASDGSTFQADIINGFQSALVDISTGYQFYPVTSGLTNNPSAYKCRWVFSDDQDNDITLEFDSLLSAFAVTEFDQSDATTDSDSLLQYAKPLCYTDKPNQMAKPLTQANDLGGTLTFDDADVDHPNPNYRGGDAGLFQADYVAFACTRSNGTVWGAPCATIPTEVAGGVWVDSMGWVDSEGWED